MFVLPLVKKVKIVQVLCWTLAALVFTGCTLPDSSELTSTPEAPAESAPTVFIASPLANATYREGVDITIQATIANAGADIARVEFFVDALSIAALQSPNPSNADTFFLTQTWPATGIGSHTISIIAFRSDGITNPPTEVTVHVIAQDNPTPGDMGIITPSGDTPPMATQVPADTGAPTPAPGNLTNTPDVPTVYLDRTMNVRRGPGTNFNPPLGTYQAGETTEILAVNPGETWLKIRYDDGEGWVYRPYVTVNGDLSTVPHEPGPPTPIPTATTLPTATSIPPANLVVVDHFVDPSQPQCGQDFTVGMTIRNESDVATDTGLAMIRDIHIASGIVNASSEGDLISVTLPPRGSHYVEVTLNVSTYVNEAHRIEFVVDVNNEITESNEGDNKQAVEYTLPVCQ